MSAPTRADLNPRVVEHNTGHFGGYTKSRRPVELVFCQAYDHVTERNCGGTSTQGLDSCQKGGAHQRRYYRTAPSR